MNYRPSSRIACSGEHFHRNANSRCGFSLMELILVVAVLLAFASLALPTVHRSLQRQGLFKGADMLRASMGKARVKAIRTGRVHAVFYLPDSPYYTVAAFDQAAEQSALAAQRQQQIENRSPSQDFAEDLLPRGIRFAQGEVDVDGRAADVLAVSGGSNALRPILFYPDGTSQDAKILLQNRKGDLVQVFLRGLTGTSTSTRVIGR